MFPPNRKGDDEDEDEEEESEDETSGVTKEIVLGSLTPGQVNHTLSYFGGEVTHFLPSRSSRLPWTLSWMKTMSMFSKWSVKSGDVHLESETGSNVTSALQLDTHHRKLY